jgi:hypothetical protein
LEEQIAPGIFGDVGGEPVFGEEFGDVDDCASYVFAWAWV